MRITDNYEDVDTGAGAPIGHTVRWDTADITYSVVDDVTSPGLKALRIAKESSGRSMISIDAGDGANHGDCFLIETNGNNLPSVWINASDTQTGYFVELGIAANQLLLRRGNGGGSFTTLSTVGKTLNANTKYWVRLARFSNGQLRARVWQYGTVEPMIWDASSSGQNTYTSGFTGVSELQTGPGVVTTLHRYSIGTAGDQGCQLDDDEFELEGMYLTSRVDSSLRRLAIDGASYAVVAIFEAEDIRRSAAHHTDKTVYVALFSTGIFRVDEFGLNRATIDNAVAGNSLYGITIDEANDLIFYSQRLNGTQFLYKNSKNGGARSTLNSTFGFFTAGECFYNPNDELVYWAIHTVPRSYNKSGVLQHSYPSFSDCLTITADATHVYVSTWNGTSLVRTTIGGSSWSTLDTTSSLWSLCFNSDESKMYAANDDGNQVVGWSAIPPSAANRFVVLSNVDGSGDLSVAYHNFPAPPIVDDYLTGAALVHPKSLGLKLSPGPGQARPLLEVAVGANISEKNA